MDIIAAGSAPAASDERRVQVEDGPALRRVDRPIVWMLVGMVAAIATVWLHGRVVARPALEASRAPATVRGGARPAGQGASTADHASIADRVVAVLIQSDVSDELKIAFVDEIARSDSDTATDMLLRTATNAPVLVSMAAIKGLSGRPCTRTEATLNELLRQDDWRQRAWAAKVLGASGCGDAIDALDERSHAESDARVRDQIADALQTLRGPATQ